MLHRLKRLVPAPLLDLYHRVLAWASAFVYKYPSEKLIVIGVTGTNGKTTTSWLIAKALEATGAKTGCTTTALFKIADREWLNDRKMTMLGRFALQKMLRDMVDAGCRYAVIETSSQGIVQHRHEGIHYDACVFTNLTPEHIEAHGGFENYKKAKIELFRHLARSKQKIVDGKTIERVAVLNKGSEHAKDFIVPGLDRIEWYGLDGDPHAVEGTVLSASDVRFNTWQTSFRVRGVEVTIQLPGVANVENATAALAVCDALNVSLDDAAKKLGQVASIPGRFERIDEGQPFTVVVDYAPEPASLAKCYDAVEMLEGNRLVHVLGSAGGGRDVARRPILGRMAAQHADLIIVTNEDPYDDDPRLIMDQVASGAIEGGADEGSVRVVPDRRQAIFDAIKLAEPGDVVLLTGKGCEQAIMGPNGSRTPWDERDVARAALRALASKA